MSGLGWVQSPTPRSAATYADAEARANVHRPLTGVQAATVAKQWKRAGASLQALAEGMGPVSVVWLLGDIHRLLDLTTNHLDRRVLYALADWVLDERRAE